MSTLTLRLVKGSPLTNAELDANFSALNADKLESATAAATYQTISGMSSYLTSATAASTYQTQSGMSSYLTSATAASTYQTQSGMSAYLTSATAASTYQTQAGMSSYLTSATAASTYQTQSGMSSYLQTSTAASTYLPIASPSYTGTLTGGTGVVNLGSGQVYKDASGNVGLGTASPGARLAVVGTGYSPEITLTDGATVNWDASTGQVAKLTLGGNRTIAAPTNLATGAFYSLNLIQDATGSRTVTWNSVFAFTGGTAPTLSTAASAVDQICFRYDGTKLREVGRSLGAA